MDIALCSYSQSCSCFAVCWQSFWIQTGNFYYQLPVFYIACLLKTLEYFREASIRYVPHPGFQSAFQLKKSNCLALACWTQRKCLISCLKILSVWGADSCCILMMFFHNMDVWILSHNTAPPKTSLLTGMLVCVCIYLGDEKVWSRRPFHSRTLKARVLIGYLPLVMLGLPHHTICFLILK